LTVRGSKKGYPNVCAKVHSQKPFGFPLGKKRGWKNNFNIRGSKKWKQKRGLLADIRPKRFEMGLTSVGEKKKKKESSRISSSG